MKRKLFTFALSTGLAFALSMGAVGCMITGLDLALQKESTVILTCLISAVLCSALLQIPHGGKILAGLSVLAAVWIVAQGTAEKQLLSLVGDVSLIYHNAYHWGWLDVGTRGAATDLPVAILGGIIALAAGFTVSRGSGTWLTVLLGALPLAACMVVTNTVPQEQFLFCLLASLVLLLLSSAVRQEDNAQGNRLTAMAAVPVMLAMLLLFWVIPQEDYVNQSLELRNKFLSYADQLPQLMDDRLAQIAAQLQEGEQKNVNLRDLGPRPQYTHTVMEVTAETGGILYLRGQDYDSYTGTGWTATPHRAETLACEGQDWGSVTIDTRTGKELLYMPYYPGEDVLLAGGMVHNRENLRHYSFQRVELPLDWEEQLEREAALQPDTVVKLTELERQAFGSTAERLRYLNLPGQTKVEAMKLLETFLDVASTRPEQARAIEDFVRSSAAYDLNTSRMPTGSEDFALWFLKESDTGYCVHYATAAVVLLRAANIPARYVTGYLVDAKNGVTTKVSAANAHAWAEYYMPGLDTWVVLDPTPSEGIPRETVRETEAPTEPSTTPVEETLPPVTETAPSIPAETTAPVEETQPPETPEEAETTGIRWLIPLGLLIFVPAQRYIRLELQKKRRQKGTTNAQALVCWQEVRLLARLLKEEIPRELFDLAQKAKFSQHTLRGEEMLVFEGYLKAARRRLRTHPWYRQLLYRYVWVVY